MREVNPLILRNKIRREKMIFIDVCVGSSCHLMGSHEIVKLIQNEIANRHLDDEVVLSGCFCLGKCNRSGVSVKVGEEVYTGITPSNFREFWENTVMPAIKNSEM